MKNALLLINPKQSPTFALDLNEKQEMTDLDTLYKIYSQCGYTVTTDSRDCPEGSIFFALKGASFNGNAFAKKALDEGCSYAVIDEKQYADYAKVLNATLKNSIAETAISISTSTKVLSSVLFRPTFKGIFL